VARPESSKGAQDPHPERGQPKQLVVASTAGITAYDPATGNEIWNYKWTFTGMPLRTVASPLYADGMVIANAGDGNGARHTIAVKAAGNGDVSANNLVWEQTRTLPYAPTMLASGGYLYFVNDLGLAGCISARTGQVIWTQRLGSNVTSSPILVDDKIYSADEKGTVYVFRASSKFELLARNEMGERVMATPAVSSNRLLIRGQEHLFCIAKPPDKRAARQESAE